MSTVAVVTGAASGIGRGIAELLLEVGWSVVGVDVRDQGPEAGGYRHVTGDVRHRETHQRAAAVADELGGLDAWVNCAGISEEVSVTDATPEHLERIISVNLFGVFWGCSVAVQRLLARGGGSIVNVSSGQALRGRDRYPAYAASKGGILGLTTQVAAEYADRHIRCNAVVPGVIETEMSAKILAESADPQLLTESWNVLSPIGRIGRPRDVAELVAFLAGDRAGFITGAAIPVDGGQMALPPDWALTRRQHADHQHADHQHADHQHAR